ncbi:MAG: phosphoenolpyruvate--protein phosphotransferase [Candidatus Zixiibacteriota bacterium]|nr:MAG: phosphoenolpyruvate--protein phosphotransferase [candidate division Zixibacteria bacterium]
MPRRKLLRGLPISSGIVLGHARVLLPGEVRVAEVPVTAVQVKDQVSDLERAVAQTISELKDLRDSAGKMIGGPVAKVFDAQLMIAGDYEFLNKVKERISIRKRNAGFVYNELIQETVRPLSKSPDPYLRQMVQDIRAVSDRVLSQLAGYKQKSTIRFSPGTILVGKSFTPGDILAYRNRKAAGFIVGEGGRSSHMALIARSLMAPVTLVERCWRFVPDDCRLIIDGTSGIAIISPTDSEWTEYQQRKKRQGPAAITRIKKLQQIPPRTSDGVPVTIAANLELPGPVDDVLSSRDFPIGLYRTEFLYLEKEKFPAEEEQFEFYRRVAETYGQNEVTLRTFDLGSDKIKSNGPGSHEDNPALGWRGIRAMLDMTDIFKAQIRAMMRASVHGNFRIILPMISDVSEVDRAKKLISQVVLDLRRKKLPYDPEVPVGIMVEVPSAALMADALARKVDFISIGSNDLTQYTLSVDRTNARVAGLYHTLHPSVLHLIKMTVDACSRHMKEVSICGEIAGDPLALPLFVGMGVTHLSMNPARIFDACRLVTKIDTNLVRLLVASVLASGTTAQVKRKLESFREALDNRNAFS